MNESKPYDLHVTTNQRRAPGAITVIDDITLFNAVALQLLLLGAWANDSASWVQFQLGLIVVVLSDQHFPVKPISQYQYHCALLKLYFLENVLTYNNRWLLSKCVLPVLDLQQ